MAINSQKFLPPSKTGAIVKSSGSIVKNNFGSNNKNSLKNIEVIKVKVIEIDKILKGTLAIEKKQLDDTKKSNTQRKREKIEERLEKKPNVEKDKIKMPTLPRMGFLDWVKNFIGNIILGYFAVRLVDHLPKIVPILKFLGKATDFILNIGGKLLNGLVTFIDWGYKAYDATRGFIKNIFGQSGVKQFDQLSSLLNQFLNLAIVAGMAVAGSGGFGGKGGGARPRPGTGGRPKVTTSGGGRAGGIDIRNPLRQRPKVTTGGANQFRFPGTGPRVTTSSAGKKALLSSVRPFLKRIPLSVIGALIDFGLSVALGENPGRAAFRAIGAGLLGAVGAAAGSIVPVAGNFILGLLGGYAGDIIGGTLYDAFFSGKSLPTGKVTKKAGGGISRGGKNPGSVKRSLNIGKKGKYKRRLKTTPKKPDDVEATSPGADVGGENKLFGLFPNPFKMFQKTSDVMNPFKVIKDTGKNLGESDYFGPILSITSKILLGQKPTQQDYKNVGLGINMLVAKGIDDGKLKGGLVAAFAEGGFVDPKALDAISQGSDISDWVARSFKESTETNAQKTLREIRENLKLKSPTINESLDPTLPTDDRLPGATSGQWGPLLDLIASVESGNSYEALNPSTTLPGATKMTISRVAVEAERIGRSKGGTGAVGRYQQLPWYLVSRAKAAGLNPDKDLFSPQNQDLIVSKVNIEQNRGGRKWLAGEISDEQFMQGLSQEFAAIPNAQGKFYYGGQKSSMTPTRVKSALGKVRSGGYSAKELSDYNTNNNVGMGKGYGKGGMQIAGNLGTHMKSLGIVTGSIHRHPQHQPWSKSGHSPGSLHYQGRAIDLGGWAPSNRNSGGRDEQAPVIKSILEWNKKNGYKPVQLIHHSPQYKNVGSYQSDHNDHVHVAYEDGGETLPYPHLATVAEDGPEVVVDNDSAYSSPQVKNMLLAINQATGYRGVMKAIQQYAPYDALSQQTIMIPILNNSVDNSDSFGSSGLSIASIGGDQDDPFDSLYIGC